MSVNPTSPHPGDPPIATSSALCPCTQQAHPSPSDPVPAEWMPLDGITQDFAAFAREATSAPALQAAGSAFHALSDEVCAHQCYSLAVRGLFPTRQQSTQAGLMQAVTDLEQAIMHWNQTAYWLSRAADECSASLDLIEDIRPLSGQAHRQIARLLCLKARLLAEWTASSSLTVPSMSLDQSKTF